jgi:hypothetical protein
MQLFHEARVFLHSWYAEGLNFSSNSVDEIIIGDSGGGYQPLNLGIIREGNSFISRLQKSAPCET